MKSNEGAAIVDGESLTIEDVILVARKNVPVVLSANSDFRKKITDGRKFYLESGVYAYGDKMGVGANVGKIIPEDKRVQFQKRLIDSLSCGIGKKLEKEIVRATMLLRANSLSKEGCSAIGIEKIERIIELLNKDIIPVMREEGSIGASGDLIPLSSIAQALQGKGKVEYKGKICKTEHLFKKLGISPLVLHEKEGLSLVNGTSVMTAMASLAFYDAEYMLNLSVAATAMATEALGGMTDPFDNFVQQMKNHPGQKKAADLLRTFLLKSFLTKNIDDLREQVKKIAEGASEIVESAIELQDPYCIRCAPQLFGPAIETMNLAQIWITNEINSANDNPIVNLQEKRVHHTGNFSGFYIAKAMDFLRLSLFDVADELNALKERLLNEKYNRGLGASLAGEEPGFNSGFKGMGLAISSVFAKNCYLSAPYSIHRRTAESYNQDVVSLGFGSAEMSLEFNKKFEILLAGVLIIAAQGMDLKSKKDPSKFAHFTSHIYKKLRKKIKFVSIDKPLDEDWAKVVKQIRNKEF